MRSFCSGGLATPKARDLLISFLDSPHRKERWASAIALGRPKEERVLALLQTLLLEGFAVSEIFESVEEFQRVQEVCRLYQAIPWGQHPEALAEAYWDFMEQLRTMDYEWYMRQRSECALILGAWGNPVGVPKLREALQAAWRMEQDWPNYQGPDESGPDLWHVFQDYLAFALGQFGAWDALLPLHLPDAHLLVARIYLILGYLQVSDPRIFYGEHTSTLFRDSPKYLRYRAWCEEQGMEVAPFVDPVRVKPLLAEHFGLSPAEQEDYLVRFSKAWYERV